MSEAGSSRRHGYEEDGVSLAEESEDIHSQADARSEINSESGFSISGISVQSGNEKKTVSVVVILLSTVHNIIYGVTYRMVQ
jgi:predicted NUDIX family NTP pyrophosphohydrolase